MSPEYPSSLKDTSLAMINVNEFLNCYCEGSFIVDSKKLKHDGPSPSQAEIHSWTMDVDSGILKLKDWKIELICLFKHYNWKILNLFAHSTETAEIW